MIRLTSFRILVTLCILAVGVAVYHVVSTGTGDEQEETSYTQRRTSLRHNDKNTQVGASDPSDEKFYPDTVAKTEEQDTAPPTPIHRVARTAPRFDRDAITRGSMGASRGGKQTTAAGSKGGVANRLLVVLGKSGMTARQRVTELEALTSSLSREEQESILQAIENQRIPEGISERAWRWIVDELLTVLRTRGADPAEITARLTAIHNNRNQDPVVRDYALQHLGHIRSEGGDPEAIHATLRQAVTEKEGTIAGTALLALNQDSSDAETGHTALEIAADSSVDLRSRITAMQVAGKQGNTATLPLAVATASSSTEPVPLRMAAIATIADLKATGQKPMLQNLLTSPDTRLRTAAKAALKKLTAEDQ